MLFCQGTQHFRAHHRPGLAQSSSGAQTNQNTRAYSWPGMKTLQTRLKERVWWKARKSREVLEWLATPGAWPAKVEVGSTGLSYLNEKWKGREVQTVFKVAAE